MQRYRFNHFGSTLVAGLVMGIIGAAPVAAIPFNPGEIPAPPKIAPRRTPRSAVSPQRATSKPLAKPKYMAEPFVTSKRNLDYERLQSLMKSGEWAEANQLTSRILLTIGKGTEQGYLTANQIRKMSCRELKTVDQLWRYYTGWRSGLSAQARVWRKLKGMTRKDAQKFEAKVGWHKRRLNPNPKAAQIGHLPFRPTGNGGTPDAWGGAWIKAMPNRLSACGLMPPAPKPVATRKTAAKKR
ncbi:GUN4 domain-containing protein [filamentous cyanobacterium LEGE 11480]|uniref:GUN4 domain-containing protein n=1 Tax=Romeriopsis navalis LEGE 11480 TaxID=2777977 RepID=A0A928VVD8_9CYAN|nr:GUN4 domain-containing protein [Romeriopsis navalis]MBE9033202.1 GUN4 domain-containing protein [Romeriopsis navalis LEGE 11480]